MGIGSDEAMLRVVVIDDDPRVRAWVRTDLERSGIARLVGESDGSTAGVARVHLRLPDVVLLDESLLWAYGSDLIGHFARAAPSAMLAVLVLPAATPSDAPVLTSAAFACYERLASSLAVQIAADHRLFRRALYGCEVAAPATIRGRLAPRDAV